MKILIINGVINCKFDITKLNGFTRPIYQLYLALSSKLNVKILSYNDNVIIDIDDCIKFYNKTIRSFSPDIIINFENALSNLLFDVKNIPTIRYLHVTPKEYKKKSSKAPYRLSWNEKIQNDISSHFVFCSKAHLKKTEKKFKRPHKVSICFPTSPMIDVLNYSHEKILEPKDFMITISRIDRGKQPFFANRYYSEKSLCFIPEIPEKNIGKIYSGIIHQEIMNKLRKAKFSVVANASYDAFPSVILESGVRGIPILCPNKINEYNPLYEAYPEWARFYVNNKNLKNIYESTSFNLNKRIKLSNIIREKYSQDNFIQQWYNVFDRL